MWSLAEIKSELKATFSLGIPAIITSLSDFFMYAANLAFMVFVSHRRRGRKEGEARRGEEGHGRGERKEIRECEVG